jgi:CheY-like chemotaxis protein
MSVEKRLAQVLLIEDSAGDALLTGQIVAESSLPVKLVIARDGVQALVMLADPAFQPALISLDLNIPLISGHVVLERNQRKDIPIVIFSVSSDENEARRAFALGAREYIQKPNDLETYKQAVLRMITKWTASDQDAVNGAAAR